MVRKLPFDRDVGESARRVDLAAPNSVECWRHIHTGSAKPVRPEPSDETSWPSQITEKVRISPSTRVMGSRAGAAGDSFTLDRQEKHTGATRRPCPLIQDSAAVRGTAAAARREPPI